MGLIDFEQLPDAARLWIFGSSKPVDSGKISFVRKSVREFIEQWLSHKREVTAGWDLKYNRFFLIGVDESGTGMSGCSIDSMVHNFRTIEKELETEIVNSHGFIFYKDAGDRVWCVSRQEFKDLAKQSIVNEETIVFNNTIQSVSELRQGKWEVSTKESWLGKVFVR